MSFTTSLVTLSSSTTITCDCTVGVVTRSEPLALTAQPSRGEAGVWKPQETSAGGEVS